MSMQHASGHHLNASVGDGLWEALHTLAERTGDSISNIVRADPWRRASIPSITAATRCRHQEPWCKGCIRDTCV